LIPRLRRRRLLKYQYQRGRQDLLTVWSTSDGGESEGDKETMHRVTPSHVYLSK
jgi:hypothetical protein